MKLFVYTADSRARRWQAAAQQHLRTVLRRLVSVVQRVELRLVDVSGAQPQTDKRCEVEARLPGGSTVRAEATSRSWGEAVRLAATELRRRVLEALREAAAAIGPHTRPALALAQAGGKAQPSPTRTRRSGQRWR